MLTYSKNANDIKIKSVIRKLKPTVNQKPLSIFVGYISND